VKKLAKYTGKKGIEFVMLSDADLQVTTLYGLVNRQKPDVPHPTTILIDAAGVVRYIRVDGDYSKRPPIEEILDAVDSLRGSS
jgi:peroxiredoxin